MKLHSANICAECWEKKYGAAFPRHLFGQRKEKCCFCGAENDDEIYIRENAETLQCEHAEKN
jgi:hypothetical protein